MPRVLFGQIGTYVFGQQWLKSVGNQPLEQPGNDFVIRFANE